MDGRIEETGDGGVEWKGRELRCLRYVRAEGNGFWCLLMGFWVVRERGFSQISELFFFKRKGGESHVSQLGVRNGEFCSSILDMSEKYLGNIYQGPNFGCKHFEVH